MKPLMKLSTTLFGLLFVFNLNAAILQQGSTVLVKLAQNVNANMNFTGETIYFEVTEDVTVENTTVIKKGEFVKGAISEAVGRKSLGKGGKLTITPKSMKTSTNQLVLFESAPLSSEGRKRTGATVAHVVMWGPLGLFAKGRAAFLMKGTEFDLTVDKDVDLKPAVPNKPVPQMQNINSMFNEYGSKINYRKGKTGKDFKLFIPMTEYTKSLPLVNKEISVVAINGEAIAQPIFASEVKMNSRKQRYEVAFDFKKMVENIIPGTVDVKIMISNNTETNARLTTEWKMK